MPELPDDLLRSTCEDDEHMRLLRELGTQTGLAVPLVARGQMLGVLTLSSAVPGRRYGRADLELAQDVASRAAIAIDNARLYLASQDAVRARSEFLTVASHELNTPMTSLLLALQSLRRAAPSGRPLDPQVMDRLLELASRQGARLTRLIDDLLDISRIDAGRRLSSSPSSSSGPSSARWPLASRRIWRDLSARSRYPTAFPSWGGGIAPASTGA